MEKSDEFDEWMLNCQNFSIKILHFAIAYFTNLTWFVMLCQNMEGVLKYFHPTLNTKDRHEDKELSDPSGPLSEVIPLLSLSAVSL